MRETVRSIGLGLFGRDASPCPDGGSRATRKGYSAIYHHTQRIGALPGLLMVAGLAAMVIGSIVVPPLVVALIAMAWAAWTFSLQTTTVTANSVEWAFRDGFWKTRVPLDEIADAKAVRNRWWFGWGIHLTPHGWLYNVGGMSAVELRLKSGRSLRVGTDEPEELAAAITTAMA